jgi:hypothetical protein
MEALCGVRTWEEHTGERKWEVLGWRGLLEAIFAPAVPAWHRTVNCRNYQGCVIQRIRIIRCIVFNTCITVLNKLGRIIRLKIPEVVV